MQEFEIEFDIKPDEFEVDISDKVIEVKPPLIDLDVVPSKAEQVFNHDGEYGYDKVTVNPIPDNFIDPVEEITINKNGKYNIREFAAADINVETGYFLKVEDTTLNFDNRTVVSGNEVIL